MRGERSEVRDEGSRVESLELRVESVEMSGSVSKLSSLNLFSVL